MYEAPTEMSPLTRIRERAQHLTNRAQRFVHDRPLQAIALTIGVGFVVGKILGAREA